MTDDDRTFASLAVLHELNSREFRRRLSLFPEEMRYFVVLANSIIGSENAKRVEGTPDAVVQDGDEFVAKLLGMAGPGEGAAFSGILETCLIEAMNDELRYACPNCINFYGCLDLDNTSIGPLFQRRVRGEETDELRQKISMMIDQVLEGTPHINTDRAQKQCKGFRHQYSVANISEVFNRYTDIAAALAGSFGIDYKRIQQAVIRINMEFYEKSREQENGEAAEA